VQEPVADEPGDRLLHWDLHDENVLASGRAPWLAIDPKPLAGDPGFELWPALDNRFDPDDIVWRFDAMTDVLALDRPRAHAWTLGRLLQNTLWDIEDDRPLDDTRLEIARRLKKPRSGVIRPGP
jgi:streptomycin 6-kinase